MPPFLNVRLMDSASLILIIDELLSSLMSTTSTSGILYPLILFLSSSKTYFPFLALK